MECSRMEENLGWSNGFPKENSLLKITEPFNRADD